MKKFRAFLTGLLLVSPLAFAHYYIARPIANPTSVVGTATLGPETSTTQWFCVNASGVVSGGPWATQALAETPCGTAVAGDGVTRYLEERVTTSRSTTQTTSTRRVELLGGTTLRVADAQAAIITQAGPRYLPPATSGDVTYYWDSLPADYYVDPEKTTNGAGTLGDPFQPNQVLMANGSGGTAVNPNGAQVIFEWLPGDLQYTDGRSSSYRAPYWRPYYSGANGAPIIHRAQYKAADPDVNPANYTSISRVGGMGSIIGTGSPGSGISDVYFDGFNIPTWAGSAGVNSEVFMFSNWSATRVKGVRMRLDGGAAGAITEPSNNYGAVWFQDHTDCEFADSLVQNIGSTSGTQIWSGLEHYSGLRLLVHNNEFRNIRGNAIFQKGETTFQNQGNRYYKNLIVDTAASGLFSYVQTTGAVLADASWWYQNIVLDAGTYGFYTNSLSPITFSSSLVVSLGQRIRPAGSDYQYQVTVAGTLGTSASGWSTTPGATFTSGTATLRVYYMHSGVVVANNLFARSGTGGVYVNNFDSIPYYVFRNNIFFSSPNSFTVEDGNAWSTWASNWSVDYNRHYSTTYITNAGGNRNFTYWHDTLLNDTNGQESDPGFTNAGADDFTRSFDQLGVDYLSLLGGSASAAINQGPYITSGMTDQIGRRL